MTKDSGSSKSARIDGRDEIECEFCHFTTHYKPIMLSHKNLQHPKSSKSAPGLANAGVEHSAEPNQVSESSALTQDYKEALEDMVGQFAYKADGKGKRPPCMFTGGLSALEHAFDVLDWPDPKPCPDSSCDVKSCQRWGSCGMPRPDGDYWSICGTHLVLIDMGDTGLEKKPGRGYNAKERKERLARR